MRVVYDFGRGVLLGAVLIGGAGAVGACSEEAPGPAVRAHPVEVAPARAGTLEETVRGVGSIAALDAVLVRAELAGRVTEVKFREGEPVEEGKALFSIESAELEERRQALVSSLEAARASASEATRSYQRAAKLFEQGIIPEQEVDQLRARMEVARAEVRRLEAEIRALEEQLGRAEVRAPFGGMVTESAVDPGDYVRIGDPLVTVVRPSGLEVEFWLPERYAGVVEPGMPVRVAPSGLGGRRFAGDVDFVSPRIDPQSRTVLVKAALEDEATALLQPGLSAVVEVVVAEREGLLIPERALVGTRDGYQVYVIEDGVAQARAVEVVLREPGRVLVRSGLEPGARVVTQGQDRISAGDLVRVIDGEATQVVARAMIGRPAHRAGSSLASLAEAGAREGDR